MPQGQCLRFYGMLLLVYLLSSGALTCPGVLMCTTAAASIVEDMDHRRWTASDHGLTAVSALAQTADGYLWLGTHAGLYRFDGFDFEPVTAADGKPLGVVSALLGTNRGLWVGLRAGGVRLISADGVLHPEDPGLPVGVVFGLAEDAQGRVWVAAADGLARHDGTRWQAFGHEAGFAERHTRAVHVDATGQVWAASEEKLYRLPPEASQFIPVAIDSQSISKIVSSPAGELWIADRAKDRVLRLTCPGAAGSDYEAIPAARTVSMVLDEQGGVWLGTLAAGVHHLAAGDRPRSFSTYTVREGLSSDTVLAQLIDRDGTLWVGTDAGLDRFRRKTRYPLAIPGGADGHALAVGGDGSLWIGSDTGQLMKLRDDKRRSYDLDMPITALTDSSHYGVLIGGYQGIFSVSDQGPVRIASLPVASAQEAAVRALVVGKQGEIWVSVNRAGLFVWAEQHWRRMEPVSDSERQVMPVTASRDLKGTLWFGYRDNLLVSVDGQKITRWSSEEGLDVGHVTAMLHVPGRTWIGGEHGLAYLHEGRFHRLELPATGPFENIYGLVAVPAEKNSDASAMDLWVHSRGGIFKLPAAEIERVIAGGSTLKYSSHDHIGQLPLDLFKVLPLPTAVYTPDGLLWFATGSGVVRVDPYQPRDGAYPPVLTIKSLIADGTEVDVSSVPVRLSAAPEKLVIRYSALNLAAPESMRFQYRLQGHDPTWVHAGRTRQATFPHLRPGDYQFQVQALGENGHVNLPAVTLAISVPQVFYLRPEFLLVCVLSLMAVVGWMFRAYARREKAVLRTRLEERFQERERIARELHDTLLQSVQGMMLSFQAVADSLPEKSRGRLAMERALDRAEQVIAEGRDRITGLRGQIAPTEDLVVAFQALTAEDGMPLSASYAMGSALTYEVNNAGEPRALRNDVRDVFYQVGREAVCNAFHHAQATRISVTFHYGSARFDMQVVDDGIGIDPLYLRMQGRPEHGGLRGIYERAGRIEANLMLDSNPRSGTRLTLSLPASMAYTNADNDQQRRPGRAG